jgi:branched-chain amino acid aminotransferase
VRRADADGYGVELELTGEQGRLSVEDWQAGANSGLITEVFACGTAAVVTPVGSVKSSRGAWTMGTGAPGPVTLKLRQTLLDVQYGRTPDSHQWMHRLTGIPAQPIR